MLGWMARVNERGVFEKTRWIAVGIRCCKREGRCCDCEADRAMRKGFMIITRKEL